MGARGGDVLCLVDRVRGNARLLVLDAIAHVVDLRRDGVGERVVLEALPAGGVERGLERGKRRDGGRRLAGEILALLLVRGDAGVAGLDLDVAADLGALAEELRAFGAGGGDGLGLGDGRRRRGGKDLLWWHGRRSGM